MQGGIIQAWGRFNDSDHTYKKGESEKGAHIGRKRQARRPSRLKALGEKKDRCREKGEIGSAGDRDLGALLSDNL